MFRKLALGLVAAASPQRCRAGSDRRFGEAVRLRRRLGRRLGIIITTSASASAMSASATRACVSQPVLTPFGYRMRLVNVCY